MSYACVIFDMDGILVDTAPFHIQAWNRFVAKYSKTMSEAFFYQTFGMKNQDIIPQVFHEPLDVDRLHNLDQEKEALFRECIKGHVQPLPGVMELFQDLQQNHVTAAIGSSGPFENVKLIVQELGLDPFLAGFESGSDVSKGKPHPEIFLKAASLCRAEPASCVVVEDAAVGVEAAIVAGMKTVTVTNTLTAQQLAAAHLVINSLREINSKILLDLLDSKKPIANL